MANINVKLILQALTQDAQKELGGIKDKLNAIAGAATALAATFVANLAVNGFGAVIKLADGLRTLESRIKLASTNAVEFASNYAQLANISFQTGTNFEANATIFSRVNKIINDLGGTSNDTLRFVDLLGKSFRLSGAGAEETSAVIRQLSQALASGVLRGDEFNSIMENGATIGQALAESLNVDIGVLRKMAEEGKLTSEIVVSALLKQGAAIDEQFKAIPLSIGAAWEKLTTVVKGYITEADNASGATTRIATAIDTLASKLQSGDLKAAFDGIALRFRKFSLQVEELFTFNNAKADLLKDAIAEIDQLITETEVPSRTPQAPVTTSGAFADVPTPAAAGSGGKSAGQFAKAVLDATLEALKTRESAAKNAHDLALKLLESEYNEKELAIKRETTDKLELDAKLTASAADQAAKKIQIERAYLEEVHQLELKAINEKIKAQEEAAKKVATITSSVKVPSQYAGMFDAATAKYGLPPGLLAAVAKQESGFNPNANSGKAYGMMQFTPGTAQDYGLKDRSNAQASIDAAGRYFKDLLEMFNGNIKLALAAYNAGPGAVQKYGNQVPPYKETQNYVKNISANLGGTSGGDDPEATAAANEKIKALEQERIAATNSYYAKLAELGIDARNNATEQATAELQIERAGNEQLKNAELERLNAAADAKLELLAVKDADAGHEVQLGIITNQELLAQERNLAAEKLAIEQRLFAEKMALRNLDEADQKAAQSRLLAAVKAYQAAISDNTYQAALEGQRATKEAFAPLENALDQSVSGVITGQQTLAQAARQSAQSIVLSYVQAFIKKRVIEEAEWAYEVAGFAGVEAQKAALAKQSEKRSVLAWLFKKAHLAQEWLFEKLGFRAVETTKAGEKLAGEAAQTGAQVVGDQARVASTAAASAETTAIKATAAKKSLLSSAASAAGEAYNALAGIPYVGPFLGAAAAIATFAAVMAFGSFIGARGGEYRVAGDGIPYSLHKDEAVLPAHVADNFRKVVDIVSGNNSADHLGTFNTMLESGALAPGLALPDAASRLVQNSQAAADDRARDRANADRANRNAGDNNFSKQEIHMNGIMVTPEKFLRSHEDTIHKMANHAVRKFKAKG